ncbi:putative methyltransferase-domain-containing protein [Parasitella parasitica]|nr:putative methyltransferase-domain-containing protein [Parasitella parasitica]
MNHASQALFPVDVDIDYFQHLQRYSALYRILLATPYSTKLTFKQWYRINLKLVNELDLSMTGQQKGNCWLEVGCQLLMEKNKSIIPCKDSSIQCRPLQHDAWDSTTASDIAGFQNDTVGDLEFMVSLRDEGYVSSSTTNAKYYIQIYPKPQKYPSIMAFPLMIGPVTMEEPSIHASNNNSWKEPSTSNAIFHGYQLQDSSFLVIREDWDLGTPGKMWDSALVLSQLMTDKINLDPDYFRGGRFIDLSAGTGCLGLLIAALYKNIYRDHKHNMPLITLTDLPEALDLINQNRSYNHLEGYTSVKPLEWGNYHDAQSLLVEGPIQTVIASDVLYRPSTFSSLVSTLVWLSDENKGQIEIYVGYKRRGLALHDETKFFDLCAESFEIITLSGAETCIKRKNNLEGWISTGGDVNDVYKGTGVNVYKLVRK